MIYAKVDNVSKVGIIATRCHHNNVWLTYFSHLVLSMGQVDKRTSGAGPHLEDLTSSSRSTIYQPPFAGHEIPWSGDNYRGFRHKGHPSCRLRQIPKNLQ